jgi:cytochrome c-type biogenesis protein CcmH/NrfG
MKSSFYKIFIPILLGALIILVSLQFVSRVPSVDQDDVDLKKALLVIEKGEEPMKGIMMLRALLEKDPNNIDVIWQLGDLSIQSGQYPKL